MPGPFSLPLPELERLSSYGDKCDCGRPASSARVSVRRQMGATVFTVREAAAVVRERRSAAGMTQSELAKKARVSRSFISDVEAGKPSVESAKLFDVFQALGYEVALRDRETGEFRW